MKEIICSPFEGEIYIVKKIERIMANMHTREISTSCLLRMNFTIPMMAIAHNETI